MDDETETGPAGATERPGHPGGGPGEQSPLQARAEFLKNRSWELIVGLNRGACARGGAQHGQNSESYATLEAEWRRRQTQVSSLDEAIAAKRSWSRCRRACCAPEAVPIPARLQHWLTAMKRHFRPERTVEVECVSVGPSPLPLSHRMGEGKTIVGGVTQGGARSSLALG